MNGKRLQILLLVIAVCCFVYFFVIGQINNNLVNLKKKATDLENEYKVAEDVRKSIKFDIESLCSMENYKKIANERNFKKPSKEQVVVLEYDKNKQE